MKPHVLIVRTAGTNCDLETAHAFEIAGATVERVYIDEVKKKKISAYQVIALPGGFTYGDDIAAGKILANEIKYKLRDEFMEFLDKGNLLIGICNGFQVLVKCGILPAFDHYFEQQSVSLVYNDSGRFEDRWIHLKVKNARCVFTRDMDDIITMPVAHAEGKFVARDDATLERMQEHIVFQYVDAEGKNAGYPCNPNGSIMDIAGITDKTGRVLGLMPHPERHLTYLHHPRHTREKQDEKGDGYYIFKNAVDYFKS